MTETHQPETERPAPEAAETETALQEPTSNDRWLGALCYCSFFVLVPVFGVRDKSGFLVGHCRQGLALLFVEIICHLGLKIVDVSIGLIPILGLLITVVLHLVVWLGCLILSVLGVVKALSGEPYRLPVIDDFADGIPIK